MYELSHISGWGDNQIFKKKLPTVIKKSSETAEIYWMGLFCQILWPVIITAGCGQGYSI